MPSPRKRFSVAGIGVRVLCATLVTGCQFRAEPCGKDASADLSAGPALPDAAVSPRDASGPPADSATLPRDASGSPADATTLPRDASGPPADLTPRSCLEVIGGPTYLRSGVPWGNGRDVKPPSTWPSPRVLDVWPTLVRFVGDCMDGSMPGPVVLDSSNKFQGNGSVFISRGPGGGIDMGGGPRTATFYGEVRGDTMTLRIKFYDGTPDHLVTLYCDDPARWPMMC